MNLEGLLGLFARPSLAGGIFSPVLALPLPCYRCALSSEAYEMTMSLLPRVLPFASLCLVDLHGCCWPICQSLALILPLLRLPHFLIELWSWEWVNGQLLLGLSSECSFSCSTGEQGVLPLVSARAVPWEKCAGLRAGHLPGHGTLGAARELLIGVSLNGNLILLYH